MHTTHKTTLRRVARPVRQRLLLLGAATLLCVTASDTALGATPVGGGAHAVQGHVDVLGVLPVDVGPLPSVTLPASGGGPITASLLSTSLLGLASVDVAKVSTQGDTDPGSADSGATVANVDVAGLVRATVAQSSCSASSMSASGTAKVVGLVVLGIPIAVVDLGPNTTIALPVATIIINEQTSASTATTTAAVKRRVRLATRRPGGRRVARAAAVQRITVNAVHVKINALGLANADITLAQSRCGVG